MPESVVGTGTGVGGTIFSGIIGAGLATLGIISAIAGIVDVIGNIFGLFGSNNDQIVKAIKEVGAYSFEGFRRFGQLAFFLSTWLWELLKRIAGQVKKLITDLGKLARPIVDALATARDWLDRIFRRFILPILGIIQKLRQFLLLLRLLHIKFADKLDNILRQIQVDIAAPFEIVRATINGIISVLEVMTDPLGIFKSGPMLWAIWRDIGQIAGLAHLAGMHGVTGVDPAQRAYYAGHFQLPKSKTLAQMNAKGQKDDEQRANQAMVAAQLRQYSAPGFPTKF